MKTVFSRLFNIKWLFLSLYMWVLTDKHVLKIISSGWAASEPVALKLTMAALVDLKIQLLSCLDKIIVR